MELLATSQAWRRMACAVVVATLGCSSSSDSQHGDSRRAANIAAEEGAASFAARDYAGAELKLTAAIDAGVLNPDAYCQAIAKRALCLAVAGKLDEALAELEKVGPAPGNFDEVMVARSFILNKQGKAADARAALAKAKKFNPKVVEFKQ